MRRSKYTAELLGPLVKSSHSFSEVIRKLGLEPNAGNHRYISGRIRYVGLDTSHFIGELAARIRELTRAELEPIVRVSYSIAAVLEALGLPTDGGCHRSMKRHLQQLELDTSHFLGMGWSRGFSRDTHPSIERATRKRTFLDEEVFVENGPPLKGSSLSIRLRRLGVEYRCSVCGISEWQGQPLVLHMDHINGIHNDHRRENLRFLCPNCHSQTDTYCNKAREPGLCYTRETRAWRNWLTNNI